MTEAIARDLMGVLSKISQGGQGVVYSAPSVKVSFAKSMVYKEYKKATLASLDVQALRAMPDFLESLPYRDGARLIELAAWPCRIVEAGGIITGFVMPSIPERFFCDFWTVNSVVPSRVVAEFQHLLNDPKVIAARLGGEGISDYQRYEVLRELILGLDFLHQHNVCVGDISPKNVLFSLGPDPGVHFIDCDAMRVDGVSPSDQVETPGWEVPAGEEKATAYSDRFKLGLLALRLLVGDQSVRDPARLPPSVPPRLASVVADTLNGAPGTRPDLGVWKAAVDQAITTASTDKTKIVWPPPPPPPSMTGPPPPSMAGPPPPSQSTPSPHLSATGAGFNSKSWWLLIPATLAGLFVLIRLASGGSAPMPPPQSQTVPITSIQAETVTATATETVTETLPSTVARSPVTELPVTPQTSFSSGVIVGTCDEAGSCGVKQRTAPYVGAPRLVMDDLQDGMPVVISCLVIGDLRSSAGYGSSNLWARLTNGAYVNTVYIDVVGAVSAIPWCRT